MICTRKIRPSSVHESARELAQPWLGHPPRHPRGALAAVAFPGEEDGGRSVARGEQLQERFLTGAALAPFARDQFLDGLEMVGKHLAVVRRAQDRGPDVRGLAHCRRVSQMGGSLLDGGAQHLAPVGYARYDL